MTNEIASESIRIFPSDHADLIQEANDRRTIVAMIIHEALQERKKVDPVNSV